MIDLVPCIKAVAPHVDAKLWADAFTGPMTHIGVTTPRTIAMLLGQCAYECSGFTELEEDLFYTTAGAVMRAWPSRFPTAASAQPYLNSPQRLANKVYADRMGNGSEASGEGWRFRGRTAIHVTGKESYQKLAKALGRDLTDQFLDSLKTPTGAALVACWWWSQHPELLALSEKWDVEAVTRIVNGGTNGLAGRIDLTSKALKVVTAVPSGSVQVAKAVPAKPLTADELNELQLQRIRT